MQNLRLELEELKHAEVLTDSTHLKQILLNVLGNAVKYTPEGGEIVLGLQELSAVIPQRSQYVLLSEITVRGCPEELLPKILICLNAVKTAVQVKSRVRDWGWQSART